MKLCPDCGCDSLIVFEHNSACSDCGYVCENSKGTVNIDIDLFEELLRKAGSEKPVSPFHP